MIISLWQFCHRMTQEYMFHPINENRKLFAIVDQMHLHLNGTRHIGERNPKLKNKKYRESE